MRLKIRHLLLVLAATVTAGAIAKLSDKPHESQPGSAASALSAPVARTAADVLAAQAPFA